MGFHHLAIATKDVKATRGRIRQTTVSSPPRV